MNVLRNLDETNSEYSTAPSDDLIRFWRSKVKVTTGRSDGEGFLVDTVNLSFVCSCMYVTRGRRLSLISAVCVAFELMHYLLCKLVLILIRLLMVIFCLLRVLDENELNGY